MDEFNNHDFGRNPLQHRQAVHWWARFWFQGLCFSQVLFRGGPEKNREAQDIRELKNLKGKDDRKSFRE